LDTDRNFREIRFWVTSKIFEHFLTRIVSRSVNRNVSSFVNRCKFVNRIVSRFVNGFVSEFINRAE
jgi:hypothetical protein